MRLHEYLQTTGTSDEQFARALGTSAGAVKKWRYRERTPRPGAIRKIHEITGGDVTASDFMETPPSPSPTEAEAAA